MMHRFAAVVVPPNTTITSARDAVTPILAPHEEQWDDDSGGTGWWDWWQIGGRWTGVWSEYDAAKDPKNIETCGLCQGMGVRPDMVIENGCNGCQGNGTRTKWATNWVLHEEDVIPVERFLSVQLQQPYTLVLPDGSAIHRETWDGARRIETPEFITLMRAALDQYRAQRLVVVDYHS